LPTAANAPACTSSNLGSPARGPPALPGDPDLPAHDPPPGRDRQCDLLEPRAEVPVGYGQTRRAYVVCAVLGFSRLSAGALIFSKSAEDILAALTRCLWRLGGLPET